MIVAVLLLVPVACTVGPDYQRPDIPVPDQWAEELSIGVFQGDAELAEWWTVLNDPVLDALIKRAAERNLDLRIATARIDQSRARLRIAGGERFPDLDGTGQATRFRPSGESPLTIPGGVEDSSILSLGADASWEIDLWGRVRRSVESATADVAASMEDRRDVRVSLFAEVATTYIELRTIQEQLAIARTNVKTQEGSLELASSRFKNGISPELDVKQAESNLATTEASIPGLQQRQAQAINRLALLLGEYPARLRKELSEPAATPLPPTRVVVGIPANLLRQRPDVRAAERRLAAQTAKIGVATADLYPQFTLSGNIGWTADNGGNLIGSDSRTWGIGPSMSWNLFDGGRVRGRIDLEDARTEESLATYERTILTAVEEVESALTAYVREQERRDALDRAVDAARRAAELSRDQYKKGLTDFNNVLDSERNVLQLEDDLAASRGRVSANLAALYRALGGGWAPPRAVVKEGPEAGS
jgi:NodT family efflux transporter outer membrane factor (OMF) lipoprotein